MLERSRMGNMTSRRVLLSVVIIVLVSLASFWGINKIFFQQDEWLGLGGAIYRQESFGTLGSIAQIFNFRNKNESIRFLPIASISNYFVYNNLKLNFTAYGILALVLIISCALALNLTVHKLTNSYLFSSLTTALWITNNLGYQSFTWIGTLVPTVVSTLFFILGLYLLLLFSEKRNIYILILSLFSVVLSLLSKEYSVFYVFPYIGLIWFFFKEKFNILSKIKLTILFLVPLVISFFIPRVIYSLYGQSDFTPSISPGDKHDLIYNAFLLPAKSLFHVFLSSEQIHKLVYSVSRTTFENQTDGFVVHRIVGDAFSLLIAFYIMLFVGIVLCFSNKENKKIILFSLFSFFTSLAPFIVFKQVGTILEPRFYILPAFFSSLLAVSTISSLTSRLKLFGKALTVLFILPLLVMNIRGVKKMLAIDIEVGRYRKGMLDTVKEIKPYLGKNPVFYFFTDHTGFWEFQSGFGQTLAVWLYDSGKVPKEALTDRDFWDPSYEGLKQYSTGKYGYFMTFKKLAKALKENPDVSLDQVHAYYWDYQKHTVKNVSEDIREKLKKSIAHEEN